MRKHYRLMIPGPIEVSPDVLAHMSDPLTAHYGDRWVEIWRKTVSNLQRVIGTEGDVFPLVGSGHTANDVVMNSLFNPGDRILTLDNGLFGKRLDDLARAFGLDSVVLEKPWGIPFEAADIHEAAAANPGLKAVFMVHGETSTGVANPVHELAAAAREHGMLVLVDTIASLGGEQYLMDAWDIDVTVCASQKALGAPPGLALVAVSDRAWDAMKDRREPRGFMADLQNLRHFAETQADVHPHPGTMPVNNFVALIRSTDDILEEGLEACWTRHRKVSRVVREGVRALGLKVMAEERAACVNMTVILSEDRIKPVAFSDFMKAEYGMHVGLGLGDYVNRSIRVGHMAHNANLETVTPFLVGLEQYLRRQGFDVERGACLAGLD